MSRPTKSQIGDLELREQVRSIDQTMREVIQPTLSQMAKDIKGMSEKDFITEEKADKKYATKEQVRRMEVLFWGIITAIILGLIQLVFKFIEGKAGGK